jgi:hypothetical protein
MWLLQLGRWAGGEASKLSEVLRCVTILYDVSLLVDSFFFPLQKQAEETSKIVNLQCYWWSLT